MKKIISLILVLVLTIGVAPFSAKAAENNFISSYEQFEITYDGRTRYFDFNIGDKGVATARLNLSSGMTKNKAYHVYVMYWDGKYYQYSKAKDFAYINQKYVDLPLNYGVDYRLGITERNMTKPDTIEGYFDGLYGGGTSLSIPTVKEVANKLCDEVRELEIKSVFLDRINLYYYCGTRHAVYVDGKYEGDHKSGGYNQIKYYIDKSKGKKLKPGSKHIIKLWPYASINGANFMGTAVQRTVTVAPFTAPAKPKVTKFTKKMVSVNFNAPIPQQRAGLSTFYIYAGKKKVKTVKNKGKASYQVTVKKKGIAKKKIKIVTKYDNRTKSSKAAKAKKNVRKWSQVKNVRAYTSLQGYVRATKVYYSGSKLMMKGFYVNGHLLKLKKFKVKLRIRVDGKIVAKKTVTVRNMKGNSIKNFKVKMKKGKYYDLRNRSVLWGYDVLADVI